MRLGGFPGPVNPFKRYEESSKMMFCHGAKFGFLPTGNQARDEKSWTQFSPAAWIENYSQSYWPAY
jgi:hypothetical protein